MVNLSTARSKPALCEKETGINPPSTLSNHSVSAITQHLQKDLAGKVEIVNCTLENGELRVTYRASRLPEAVQSLITASIRRLCGLHVHAPESLSTMHARTCNKADADSPFAVSGSGSGLNVDI